MHILLIHQAFTAIDEPGGTRHHEIALYLASKGHRITIIASPVSYLTGKTIGGSPNETGHENIKILRPRVYRGLHRSFYHRVLNFVSFMFSSFWWGMKVKSIDLVWGTSPPIFQGLSAWVLSRFKGVPFLFEVRDLWPAFAVAVGVLKNRGLIKSSEWLERFLYRRADQLVVNSPGFIDHVISQGAKTVLAVPNGADTSMFQPECMGLDFRATYQLEGKTIAMYAGAHGMSNDLEVLLAAADQLRGLKNLVIVLVGDGKEKPNLLRRAHEMDLDNVVFIPPVPKDQIAEVLAAADVCIAILKPIELYKTVYPNKVFDYMAAGRPVVLAIDGVIREVLESAEAGIPVSPGSPETLAAALRYYVDNPHKGREHGMNGRKFVKDHFDREASAQKLMELMENMVKAAA